MIHRRSSCQLSGVVPATEEERMNEWSSLEQGREQSGSLIDWIGVGIGTGAQDWVGVAL